MSISLNPIDIGDSLPSFILKNEKGEDVDVSTLAEEKGLVLFAVPGADTAGCNTQACAFRDSFPDFSEHGVNVFCISHDTTDKQAEWQLKKSLPYPLLSDPDRVLIEALGAKNPSTGRTQRSHFIIAKGGKLVQKKVAVSATESTGLALESIKSLKESL